METRLISRTSGVAGTEYAGRSVDEIIVGIARVSSSRETNELFDEPHKLLRHCLLNGHWCFDKETEILTEHGFKFVSEISENDKIGNFYLGKDYVSFSKPIAINKQMYSGKLIGLNSRYIDFLVTPNHRLIYKKPNKGKFYIDNAEQVYKYNKHSSLFIKFADKCKSKHEDIFSKYGDKFYSLIGFFIGDGSTKTSCAGLEFHLRVKRKIQYLINLCKELNLPLKINLHQDEYLVHVKELKTIFSGLFYENKKKTMPSWFIKLDKAKKDFLLDGLMNSDGHTNFAGSRRYDTTSDILANKIQEVFCCGGYHTHLVKTDKVVGGILVKEYLKKIYISNRKYCGIKTGVAGKWYEQDYNDFVYCVSVKSGFVVIRRNGKVSISGNSVFDTCNLTFEVKTSRAVGRELLRHSSIKPQEFSQRYSNVQAFEDIEFRQQAKNNRQSSTDKVGSIIYNSYWGNEGFDSLTCLGFNGGSEFFDKSSQALNDIVSCYEDLIKAGVSRETARMILPETAQTTLIFNGTIRSWITLLNVRLHNTAQKECRLVAESIRDVFIKECPIIANSLFNFEDAYDIHVLDKLVLEKWGALEAVKANGFKKLVRANQCNQV